MKQFELLLVQHLLEFEFYAFSISEFGEFMIDVQHPRSDGYLIRHAISKNGDAMMPVIIRKNYERSNDNVNK